MNGIHVRIRRAKGRAERGVVSVLVAFVLLALTGMLALAVDVGYAFGQRRLAQNVADSASLAGARVIAERLMNKPRTDASVLAAVRDVARNSSGEFLGAGTTGAYDPTRDLYTAVYVADANSDGVPESIVPEVRVGSAPGGAIPSNARGVRVLPRKQGGPMFGALLGQNGLTATATAAALALDAVGFGDWAPYAIWAGEDEHRCFNDDYDKDSGYRLDGGQYVYGCIPPYGGTRTTPGGGSYSGSGTLAGPGGRNINTNCWYPTQQSGCRRTRIAYYSPSYKSGNVTNGDSADSSASPLGVVSGVTGGTRRWNYQDAAFKGFFHSSNQTIDIDTASGAVIDVNSTGMAVGSSDLARLHTCWLANQAVPVEEPVCLMVMPVVRYTEGTGGISLTVVGFHAVRLANDPYSNDPEWQADLVETVLTSRTIKTGPCPDNGVPCLKVVRLVE